MRKKNRYDISGLLEAQFEPGSRKQVLKNLLDIKSKISMESAEAGALEQFTALSIEKVKKNHRFTADDICSMHDYWLGKIYPWAGKYRQVQLSKGNFSFAFAAQISALMKTFEHEVLARHTPCNFSERQRIIQALAEVHTELVLIHPFREGNGRISRLLATLMALQADLPQLNFGSLEGPLKNQYFAAVRAGMDKNYGPMEKIFEEVIRRTES
jgi:cell filamentation protein